MILTTKLIDIWDIGHDDTVYEFLIIVHTDTTQIAATRVYGETERRQQERAYMEQYNITDWRYIGYSVRNLSVLQ